jgi:DNA polymerase zeta
VHTYIRNLRNPLNEALANSRRRSEQTRSDWRYIRHILFVKGMPFYGFHHNYHTYLKILLADPNLLQTAATILRSGAIFNNAFAVYEAHLGYTLQFMIDFNLYGCGWLENRDAWLRGDVDDSGKWRICGVFTLYCSKL